MCGVQVNKSNINYVETNLISVGCVCRRFICFRSDGSSYFVGRLAFSAHVFVAAGQRFEALADLNSLGEPFSIDYLNWIGLLRPYLTAVSGGRSGWSVEPVAIQWQVTGEGKTEPFKRQTAR